MEEVRIILIIKGFPQLILETDQSGIFHVFVSRK